MDLGMRATARVEKILMDGITHCSDIITAQWKQDINADVNDHNRVSKCLPAVADMKWRCKRPSVMQTTFRQIPTVLLQHTLLWPLGWCHFVFTVWRGTQATATTWERERSRLTFLCFPVNHGYCSYLMMQKQSNMTFKVTILYCGTVTPPPATLLSTCTYTDCWFLHLHGFQIKTNG